MEVGFAAAVALVFVSAAAAAHYKHPAILVAWEWVVFLLAFSLVRQLVRTADDGHSLLAAILATAVSLSGYAVYQYTVEMPGYRAALEDPRKLRQELAMLNIHLEPDRTSMIAQAIAAQGLVSPGGASSIVPQATVVLTVAHLEPNDSHLAAYQKRIQENNVFATYAHPNSFAGFLALLLPAAVGWAVISRRREGWGSSTLAVLSLTVLMGVALWFTHSRGAILALLLVGATVLVIYERRSWQPYKVWIVAGFVVLLGAAFILSRTEWGTEGLGKAQRSFGLRSEYWAATWRMIGEHPWLGVGPGNFGRHYPRYMAETASEKVQDPHNFALEIWATCGIFALLALLATLAAFFRRTWHVLLCPESVVSASERKAASRALRIRWEFYLGGMAGLILGFVLRAGDRSADQILLEGVLSGGRSLIWFAAFALLDNIPWSGPSRSVALTAGVAALLLNLMVSGGIAQPSVALPLWVMAALAINSLAPEPNVWQPRSWLAWVVPLPVLAGLGLAYFLLVFYPVTSCAASLAEARRHYGEDRGMLGWHNKVERHWLGQLQEEKSSQKKLQALQGAHTYLKDYILRPLETATRDDPGDATPWVELAHWYGEQAKLYRNGSDSSRKALAAAKTAQQLDPDGKEGYLAEYRLRVDLAERLKVNAREHYGYAAMALDALVRRDPTDAPLRYQLAETLFRADDPVKAREHAEAARRLDQFATAPGRSLTDPQREQIDKWLSRLPAN
jgi:hypothetical protein